MAHGFCVAHPSVIDGEPCVTVITTRTVNKKTGPVWQAWHLRADLSPLEAQRHGGDVSVCGDCPLRGSMHGGCYVTVFRAPLEIWTTWRAGGYAPLPERFECDMLRLGAYGDPVAVPLELGERLVRGSRRTIGYTHRWRWQKAQPWRRWIMASVDSQGERKEAQAMGWRTYRVRRQGEALLSGEFVCPASDEAGHARRCSECLACDGAARGVRKGSVAIYGHGPLRGK